MSEKLNERNIRSLADAANGEARRLSDLFGTVAQLQRTIITQQQEVAALRKDVVLLRMQITGSGPTAG